MIRIRIELVPCGVEEMAHEVDSFILACRFPLTPTAQDYHILHGDEYGLLEKYDSTGDTGYLELVGAALGALAERRVSLEGGEVYPGTLALTPAEFDKQLAALVKYAGQYIHSIRLFGRRAREDVSAADFLDKLEALSRDKQRKTPLGQFIFTEYPGYVVYDLAVRLFRKHYQDGPVAAAEKTYPTRGEMLEEALTVFCWRPFPLAPRMLCNNGLRLAFIRPGDEIATRLNRDNWQAGATTLHTEQSDPKLFRDLHADIRAGRVLYDARGGLRPYPGAPAGARADVLPAPVRQLAGPA